MFEKIDLKNGDIVEIDFDIETNLPKLPKGYFWRIKPGDFGSVDVQLRKRGRWGSSPIDYCITDTLEIEWIRVLAGRIWYDFNQKNKHRLAHQEFASKWYGDYPPKKAL